MCVHVRVYVCVGVHGCVCVCECVGVYMRAHGCNVNCIVAACCPWNVMLAASRTMNAVRLLGNRTEPSCVVQLQFSPLVI